MQRWQLSKIFGRTLGQISGKISGRILLLLGLSLTALSLPSCTINQPPKPFSSEALPTEAIAEISEIRSYPVRVKYINSSSARPATVGVPLKVNESVSTEDQSTAQVTLRSGTIIRIGGNAKLTLKPQNQVEFASGRLVAWAASDRKAPAQIKTTFGEISSNDGTLYLEIPEKAAEDRRIMALDGTVTVLLKSTSEIVTIGKGEEIKIKADGKATAPKRIDKESIDKRIANNSLIFGFNNQLASLPQITSEFGVTATVKEASTIQFRRSDLPTKPANDANKPKVTYTSGSANNDRREEQSSPRREEQAAAKNTEPAPSAKPAEPTPVDPKSPTTPPPSEPSPVTTNTPPKPIEPVAPQPVPLEPPPQPVQPEIPAPEPLPSTKPKN
ncbi:FecR domain-containing protein [Pseudanabaena sp. FACHB-1998]|uniref:FecR domain-containing protein n=1 Tax=Pseudanabaena sp. FACHB-1998 TaxID=2692858 RepID=UPI0016811448|nr:FecR domain-containing protein [Pseudanabaena sp. FACHB-1998]MBD2175484.1 FecR domain-containing protein [Pseudanabaena sp. FACHB-1998]